MKNSITELTEERFDCVVGGAFVLKWSRLDEDTIICAIMDESSTQGSATRFSQTRKKEHKIFTAAEFKKYVTEMTEKYKDQGGLKTQECQVIDIM